MTYLSVAADQVPWQLPAGQPRVAVVRERQGIPVHDAHTSARRQGGQPTVPHDGRHGGHLRQRHAETHHEADVPGGDLAIKGFRTGSQGIVATY